jgi:hypothetical protein
MGAPNRTPGWHQQPQHPCKTLKEQVTMNESPTVTSQPKSACRGGLAEPAAASDAAAHSNHAQLAAAAASASSSMHVLSATRAFQPAGATVQPREDVHVEPL